MLAQTPGSETASNRRCLALFGRRNTVVWSKKVNRSQQSFFSHPNRTPARVRSHGCPQQNPTGHSDFYTRDGADEAQFEHTLSVSRRARSRIRTSKVILLPPETLWRSSRETSVQAYNQTNPTLFNSSMILKKTAEVSPLDIYFPETPASIPSRSAIPRHCRSM